MTFEIKVRDGKFFVSYCPKCEKTVWPPSNFCNVCFTSCVSKDVSPIGILLECSKNNGECFGLAEFDQKIRLIGKIQGDNIQEGMKVKLQNCDISNGSYRYELTLT